MTKLEQDFETWWKREGQEFLFALNTTTDDDIKLVAEIAWKNGAYCFEQADQEPVGYFAYDEEHDIWEELTGPNAPGATQLYAAPVRTKDLTDEEIDALIDDACKSQMPYDMFARAVIAADREKNNV